MSNTGGSESDSTAEPTLRDPFSIIPIEFQVEILDKIWCSVTFYSERGSELGGPMPEKNIFEKLVSHINIHYGPNSKGQRYNKDGKTPPDITVIPTLLDSTTIGQIWKYINRQVTIPGDETWDTYRRKQWADQWNGIKQPRRRGEIGYTAVTTDEAGAAYGHMVARRYFWPEDRKKACQERELFRRGRFRMEQVYEGNPYNWRFFGYKDPDPSHPEPDKQEIVAGNSATDSAIRKGAIWNNIDNGKGTPSGKLM
ncbi:hypothetical protein MMC17_007818 [Xylographa soralifera]|nr:hypothetical protein [Xylographa soralifera]